MATAMPVNSMGGLVGGLVVRRTTTSSLHDPTFGGGAARPDVVVGATLTLLRLTLGTERLAERGVHRGPASYRLAEVPISNPDFPGTMCTATSTAGGLFCLPFTCHDDSLVVSQLPGGSAADLRVGAMTEDHTRYTALRTIRLRDFRMVPGGQALRPVLTSLLNPVDTLVDGLEDELLNFPWSEYTAPLEDAMEASARIAGLISGITVPGARALLVKMVIVAI